MDRRGWPEWQYKQQAVEQVAQAFAGFWKWAEIHRRHQVALISIPPSKSCGDPLYDPRMATMLNLLAQRVGIPLDIRDCLSFSGIRTASHEGPQRPSPDDLYAALNFDPASGRPDEPPGVIFVFDDILTTSAHFVAATRKLAETYLDVQMVGHFIARRIIPDPFGSTQGR